MGGFTRRYSYVPGIDQATLIEGVVIADVPPPGSINGVSSGTVAIVGEFQDMSYGGVFSSVGAWSTKAQPVEVFSGQDLANKGGGFDPTIGEFGLSSGNAFAELRNKKFTRLVIVPINLASDKGMRLFRQLPTNASLTSPQPVIPMQAVKVAAGTQFVDTTPNRVRTASPVAFSDAQLLISGVDGAATSAGSAATHTFSAAGGLFITNAIKKGMGLALGVIHAISIKVTTAGANIAANPQIEFSLDGGAYSGPQVVGVGANILGTTGVSVTFVDGTFVLNDTWTLTSGKPAVTAASANTSTATATSTFSVGTFRVTADAASETSLTVELPNGASWDWSTATAQPWRIHPGDSFDSFGNGSSIASGNAGCLVAARPLDATIGATTSLTPSVVPTAASATSWDPLSGLGAVSGASAITYTAALQAPNAVASASFDALYQTALDALLTTDLPAREVNIVFCARTSATIRAALKSHVLTATGQGIGRMACIRPDLSVQSTNAAIADTSPGVGATRDEKVMYAWPAAQSSVPEAVNISLKGADGHYYTDGIIDQGLDGWLAAVLSNLPPEFNPAQTSDPVTTVMAPVLGFQRGVSGLGINDYIQYRAKGIVALKQEPAGWFFQSGVTTSLTSGQKTINRRRMAFFIQDSLAISLLPKAKELMTEAWKDDVVGETVAFFDELVSVNNPGAARIAAYSVDDKSGNTAAGLAAGVFVVITKVQTLPSADVILIQAEVGTNVKVSTN